MQAAWQCIAMNSLGNVVLLVQVSVFHILRVDWSFYCDIYDVDAIQTQGQEALSQDALACGMKSYVIVFFDFP